MRGATTHLSWGILPVLPRARVVTVSAHAGFFPAAIICALGTVPLWAVLSADRPDLAPWHGHEMLLGYGLAVVAGFLLAQVEIATLSALLALWAATRIAALTLPAAGGVAALTFVGLLAWLAGVPFLRTAKKGRNAVFGLILIGFSVAEALYQAGHAGLIGDGENRGLLAALDLLTLLMLQMGGRVIPAATAGALHRRGEHLVARVQPRLETAIGILMLVVLAADQVAAGAPFAGTARLVAAALTAVRLLRWRPWAIVDIPDLVTLHVGYAWLPVGLALAGFGAFFDSSWWMAGLHAIGIGALGSLTVVMMARTAAARRRPERAVPAAIVAVVALLAIAAALRIAAAFAGAPFLLPGAAAAWTFAFLTFGVVYWRIVFSRR